MRLSQIATSNNVSMLLLPLIGFVWCWPISFSFIHLNLTFGKLAKNDRKYHIHSPREHRRPRWVAVSGVEMYGRQGTLQPGYPNAIVLNRIDVWRAHLYHKFFGAAMTIWSRPDDRQHQTQRGCSRPDECEMLMLRACQWVLQVSEWRSFEAQLRDVKRDFYA